MYTNMTREEVEVFGKELNSLVDEHSRILNDFPKGQMGLVPEYIRLSPDYRKALSDFNRTFAELRNFNGWYVKEFMKKKR